MKDHFALLASVALLVAVPASGTQAGEEGITAHLRALETGRSGREVRVRLELSWPGRPELHLVSAPSIEIPSNGASRAGLSRSRFDGTSTRWSHDAIVTLPQSSGPWTIGPAQVTVRSRDGSEQEVVAAAIRTGRASRNTRLLRQGLGNGIVACFALFFGLWRYRRLKAEEDPADSAVNDLIAQAHTAASASPEGLASRELLESLLELRLALAGQGVDNDALWTTEQIQERIDQIRFGGEEVLADECLQMLRAMEHAAATSTSGTPGRARTGSEDSHE